MAEVATADALWGGIEPEPDEAVRFMQVWHQEAMSGGGCADKCGVLALTPLRVSGVADRSKFRTPDVMVETIRAAGLMDLTWDRSGVPCNLYMAAAWLKGVPEDVVSTRRPFARGTKRDVGWSPGIWCDLDVGPGKFASQADAVEAMRVCARVGISPSVLVSTGSGGLHGYFRAAGGLEPGDAERMGERLQLWLQAELGGGIKLDRVFNADRILRLPGSVRFPKRGEEGAGFGAGGSLCEVLWAESRVVLDLARMGELTESCWTAAQEAVRVRRERTRAEGLDALEALSRVGGYWGTLMGVAGLETDFSDKWTWEDVLEPYGWRLLDGDGAVDGSGRRTWTRPGLVGAVGAGVNRRSLLTDWVENPHVATLKSESPETGLLGLLEREIPLSKFRVWLELGEWMGDVVGFIRAGMPGLR